MDQTTFADPSSTVPVPAGGSPTTNTGDGTVSTPIPSSATLTEDFTITCTVPGGSGVGQFSVTGSVSGLIGTATSNTEFVDADQKVRFTITAGGTPWAVSDEWTFSTVAGTILNEANFDEFASEIARVEIEPQVDRVERFTHLFEGTSQDVFGFGLTSGGDGTWSLVDRIRGIIELQTTATSASFSYFWPGAAVGVQNSSFVLGSNEARFSCRANTADFGTTNKIVIIGWGDATPGLLITTADQKGVFFRVEAGGSGVNVSCVTKNGIAGAGNETVTDSGISDSSTYHVFEIKATSSSVEFYIDGDLKATHTTDIPSADIAVRVGIRNTAAEDKQMRVDWIKESLPV